MLLVALREPREDDLADVGLAVAIGVLEEPDVRRGRDEDAAPPGHDARRVRDLVHEEADAVDLAVAIRVLQQPDPAGRRPEGVVRHLGDVDAPVLVEGHRDRVHHIRLRGDEVDAEARLEPERLQRVLGRQRPGGILT
jgi:hypothetical protein